MVLVEAFFRLFILFIVLWTANPYYVMVFIICGFFFEKLMKLYRNASRSIRRLHDMANSPVVSHIQ